jgi:hypothetical protein
MILKRLQTFTTTACALLILCSCLSTACGRGADAAALAPRHDESRITTTYAAGSEAAATAASTMDAVAPAAASIADTIAPAAASIAGAVAPAEGFPTSGAVVAGNPPGTDPAPSDPAQGEQVDYTAASGETYSGPGWHWKDLDGDLLYECYYTDPQGRPVTGCVTPDGHQVDETGAWVDQGRIQYHLLGDKDCKVSDYIMEIMKYSQYPDLDDEVCKILDSFEANKNRNQTLTVFTGSKKDMERLYDYYTFVYSFTGNMMVNMAKLTNPNVTEDNAYILYFKDTLNADKRLYDFVTQAAKAYRIARSLCAGTPEETADRIKNWISANVPASGLSPTVEELEEANYSYYYGVYDGKPSTCAGNTLAFCQLGSMNGLHVDFVGGSVTSTGEGHCWNRLDLGGRTIWADLTWHLSGDTLWPSHQIAWWHLA